MMNKIVYNLSQLLRILGKDFNESSDPRIQKMQTEIKNLGNIQFTVEINSDGSWVAESSNIDGIITGGLNVQKDDLNVIMKDAIFTYFEIPPHLCTDYLLKGQNEAVVVTKRVYA